MQWDIASYLQGYLESQRVTSVSEYMGKLEILNHFKMVQLLWKIVI